jgi:hypothetical protein
MGWYNDLLFSNLHLRTAHLAKLICCCGNVLKEVRQWYSVKVPVSKIQVEKGLIQKYNLAIVILPDIASW